ncbi:hypothetical protein [Caulobacter sp. FWC2]|uniref:hypothetical protein n=1 Tax=Caulobacter sp. FWC2 TaxID=69664 RepID=UPI000C14CCD9|nr:hypothetical protein [Caulobacter sp. FWC2]PIB91247.1 hypothetical protein CSW62_06455 [Caulobacter sp. FWC2]
MTTEPTLEELLAIAKAAKKSEPCTVWHDDFIATFNPAFVLSLLERAQAAEARARMAEEALKAIDAVRVNKSVDNIWSALDRARVIAKRALSDLNAKKEA